MGAVIAAAAARAERDVVESLRAARAFDPASATPVYDLPPLGERRLARLVAVGAVIATADGYYLDEARYAAYRQRRRKMAMIAIAVAILICIALVARDAFRAAAQ